MAIPPKSTQGPPVRPLRVYAGAVTFSDGELIPFVADANGAILVKLSGGAGSGGTSSSFGLAFPAAGTAAGFQDINGNMAAANLDASGNLKITFSGVGTLANPMRVDPVGSTPQPVSQSGSWTAAITNSNLDAPISGLLTQSDFDTKTGSLTETAPATDTASSGLNGRLQRIAQRLTSILAKQPALGTAGSASADVITVQGIASGTVIPISGTVTAQAGTNLNTSALALETGGNLAAAKADLDTLAATVTAAKVQVNITNASLAITAASLPLPTGASTETTLAAAKTDLDTLAGAVTSAKIQVNISQINGAVPLMGNGVSGTGVQRVTIASDSTGQIALAAGVAEVGNVKNSGTFAVQAAQSGAWNITNISGTVSLPTGASTAAKQPALGTAGTASADVITIQGIASMTKLLVTPDANSAVNVAQFGGSNAVIGTGASGSGVPRVTVSNDSQVKVWDGTNTGAVKAAATPPVITDPAQVVSLSPNNTGIPVNIPVIVQKTSQSSTGSVASLAKAFVSNNIAGNTIIVVCGVGNGTTPTVTDSLGNTYTRATVVANGTAFNVSIFYAVNILVGANTVTVNNGGSTASIAMEIYEASGLLNVIAAQPDAITTNTGTSATAVASPVAASSPNALAFVAVGVGTAAQTITAGSGWTSDSGQLNPTTPAGLFSFISMSQYLGSLAAVIPQATFTSEPWAIAAVTFRPVAFGIQGQVVALPSNAPEAAAYTKRYDYDGSGNAIYIAWAKSGVTPLASQAVWAIQRITVNGSNQTTLTEWADGDSQQDNIWNNRASLTYA